jgi:osmotically-inducible protein OsmY
MERAVTMGAVIGLCLGLSGCEAATNAAANVDAFAQKTAQKIEEGTDDTAITVAVKAELLKRDDALGKAVSVSTGKGIVSLTGAVPTPDAKAKAEQIASGVRGVVRVINAIDVVPAPPSR